jgi:hypothetical protein
MFPCTWTKEEDDIIIKNRKDNKTYKDIAMLLDGKSEVQVSNHNRYSILTGKNPSTRCTWTKEEDAIIIENKKGNKTNKHIATLLEGKSKTEVANRSRSLIWKETLNPSTSTRCTWTKEEDDIIIENKKDKKSNKDIATLLEGKTKIQVKNRSRFLINKGTLNPSTSTRCTWTKEEDAIIIENKKGNKTNKHIATLLEGKSKTEVVNRSIVLINKGTLNPSTRCTWTKEEDAIIIENKKGNKTNKHIATLLEGKSKTEVANRSTVLISKGTLKMVAKKYFLWTKEEDDIIIENKKDKKSNKDIAMLLEGKSYTQVKNRFSFLINEGTLKTVAKKKKAPVTKVRFHINK